MDIDLRALFEPSAPIAETILRGTIVYLALFLLFRFVIHRRAGGFAPSDFMLVLLVSEASQNGMANGTTTITESLVLVATLASWDYALDWIAVRSRLVKKLITPPGRVLVADGVPRRDALRKELMTMDDLLMAIREQGVDAVVDVKRARMEADGQVSVIPRTQRT